mmetsp:Transcript_25439/g.74914  ORF Transcript_25439/g.74914 Transcript_25439/m.74914 type:complete len:236 (-) Transcript_25439:2357-3064(-)
MHVVTLYRTPHIYRREVVPFDPANPHPHDKHIFISFCRIWNGSERSFDDDGVVFRHSVGEKGGQVEESSSNASVWVNVSSAGSTRGPARRFEWAAFLLRTKEDAPSPSSGDDGAQEDIPSACCHGARLHLPAKAELFSIDVLALLHDERSRRQDDCRRRSEVRLSNAVSVAQIPETESHLARSLLVVIVVGGRRLLRPDDQRNFREEVRWHQGHGLGWADGPSASVRGFLVHRRT